MGKSYRILRSDMEAMTGVIPGARPTAARVTAIVDVSDVEPAKAQALARVLPAMRMGREAAPEPMSLDVAHDAARRTVKVIITGSPADVAAMLNMIQVQTET